MGSPTGTALLPLHGGRVPRWLSERMARLGRVVTEAIVLEYGRDEMLRRLAHPYWFQAFGAVMGMDWHSSGITTTVLGALKRGLAPVSRELGLHVCGGRGAQSHATPGDLVALGEAIGFDGAALARTSRLVAKVDSAAVQDGFALYLHGFIVTDEGKWAVVQQGMNGERREARRYHWLSEGLESFVASPHTAIDGASQGEIVNLTDRRAAASHRAQLALLRAGPEAIMRELVNLRPPVMDPLPNLQMPSHHAVREGDVVLRRLRGALAAASEAAPRDFADLLLTPGVGLRTVESLALVAEVVHGAPCRFTDPARFAMAHGGKDGQPFPVPVDVVDRTIAVLRRAVDQAKLGNDERLAAIRRLDAEARRLERVADAPAFDAHVAAERAASHRYGGRTVDGPALPPARPRKGQLPLLD
jgi:uncharacterized protein